MKILTVVSITTLMAINVTAGEKNSFLQMLDPDPEIRISSKEITRNCVDFSGTWKGTCKVKEQTADEQVRIEQKGCQLIEVTGHDGKNIRLPVGGVVRSSLTIPGEPGFTGSGELTSHWNEDRTVLQVIMGKTGKKLTIDSPTHGKMVSQQIKLVEGKLTVDFTAYQHKDKTTGTCQFTKE